MLKLRFRAPSMTPHDTFWVPLYGNSRQISIRRVHFVGKAQPNIGGSVAYRFTWPNWSRMFDRPSAPKGVTVCYLFKWNLGLTLSLKSSRIAKRRRNGVTVASRKFSNSTRIPNKFRALWYGRWIKLVSFKLIIFHGFRFVLLIGWEIFPRVVRILIGIIKGTLGSSHYFILRSKKCYSIQRTRYLTASTS